MTDTHTPPIFAALIGLLAMVSAWGLLVWQGMAVPSAVAAALILGGSVSVATAGMAAAEDLVGRLRWLLWPQIAAVIVITWMAYLHILPTTLLRFPHSDKVLHFTLFGLVAFFAELWLEDRRWARLPVAIVLPLSLAATEELAQTLSPHRTADLGDLACDLAGMSIAWLLARRLSSRSL
jgi:VanZ family protein